MNGRNMNLLVRLNPKKLYPLADDKVQTKELCARHAIPVPRTYAIIEHPVQVKSALEMLEDRGEFVAKPARGSGGRGVLVVIGRRDGGFVASDGRRLPWSEVHYHLQATLAGAFSIGGRPDRVIVEQRIARHAAFDGLAIDGTPDVRLIVYRGCVIMAMLRLPTRRSGGRANLHQGALGLGLDVDSGVSTGGICGGKAVDAHPDTGAPLAGITVPHWAAVLAMARKLAAAIGLGYLGVDIVLGPRGPLVLEANGRPGLSIQVANRRGLLKRITEAETQMTNS
jgi:alpha-L-glutamate ligase-like protein